MATRTRSRLVAANIAGMSCSDGWYITGYFTPGEEQYNGNPVAVNVRDKGADQFPADFLHAVSIEGWGRTRHGWFLGWDGQHSWVSNDAALNARGRPLQTGSLAVDRHVIPMGTTVRIEGLPAPWNQQVFVADDTGGAILGKHVDVYCGAGAAAKTETYRITGSGRRVCIGGS